MHYEDEEAEYSEAHSGTGKILGVFLALVVACAVFFGLGYSMGRSTGSAAKSGSLVTDAAAAPAAEASKPSPAVPADSTSPCPQGQDCSAAASSPSDQMTFYKSVEQKDANAQLTPPPAPAEKQASPAPASKAVPSTAPGFAVQVAAVSKRQDAEALVDALHRKHYPAFVTSAAGDKLLHVQVGPFAGLKDAEAMKARLAADGYNPILKK